MGEVVSGLRFRKNHIVPQPTHEEGVWTLAIYHDGELVREIPLWDARPTTPREPDCYQIRGYAVLEGTARPFGNTAHVTVPRKHLGKRVKVVVLEP